MTSDEVIRILKEAIWGPWVPPEANFPNRMSDPAARLQYATDTEKSFEAARDKTRTDQSYWDATRYCDFWRLTRRVLEIAAQQSGELADAGPPPGYGLNPNLSDWVERFAT